MLIIKQAHFYFLFAALLLFTGCFTTTPLKKEIDYNLQMTSTEKVENAIRASCVDRGWVFKEISGNEFEASLQLRSHRVKIRIIYTLDNLKFKYISSENMHYDGKNIHKKYNIWIERLYASINRYLATTM